jgi:cation:H+ antiporter
MVSYGLLFIASASAVVVSAIWLSRCAEAIAEATGLGRVWTGTLLLAGATSLPELATDLSAVRLGAVDLAVGDLFGSSMANMLILALVDLARRDARLLQRAALDHALGAAFAIGLNALAVMLVLLRTPRAIAGWIGPGSLELLGAYLAGARVVYRHASRQTSAKPPHAQPANTAFRPALLRS